LTVYRFAVPTERARHGARPDTIRWSVAQTATLAPTTGKCGYWQAIELGEHMDELQLLRDAKIALKREHSRIIHLYEQEIYDRCGYDLACELVAQKSFLPEPIVRSTRANETCSANTAWARIASRERSHD